MNFLRSVLVLISVVAWALAPSASRAATINAVVKAKVVKPVQLTSKRALDFGTILVSGVTSSVTVSIATNGTRTCPAPISCAGTALPGILNVAGSNGEIVLISAPAVDLVNATGLKLRFTPTVPTSVTLTNSGSSGTDFNMGGSITLTSTTADGTYSGVVTVTADYQ